MTAADEGNHCVGTRQMLFHLIRAWSERDYYSILQMKWRLRGSTMNPSTGSQQAARAQIHTLFRPLSCACLTAPPGTHENWGPEWSMILVQPSCPLYLCARRMERKE